MEGDGNNKNSPIIHPEHFSHTYRFPQWNPVNDPSDISLPFAFKIYMHCIISNHFRTASKRYFDSHTRDCIVEWNDVMLCLKVTAEKDEAKKRKMLENAYPWVCDSTQGFRHRHVYQFRNRPPPPFDDKDITTAEYDAMRNTAVNFNKGAILSRVYHFFVPYYYCRLAQLSPRDFLAYIRPTIIAAQTIDEEASEADEIIKTSVKIVSGTEEGSVAFVDDQKKQEIEEVTSNINEIFDIFDVSNASARRKEEYEASLQQLIGRDSKKVENALQKVKNVLIDSDAEVQKSEKSEKNTKTGEKDKTQKINPIKRVLFSNFFVRNKNENKREPLLSTIWRKANSSFESFKEKKHKDSLEKIDLERNNYKIDLLLSSKNEEKGDKKENKP